MKKKLDQYNTTKEKTFSFVIVVGVLLFLFWGVGNLFLRSDIKDPHLFNTSYAVLIEALEHHEVAIFLPGSGNNSTRQDLNIILEKVLTKTTIKEERLSGSLLGLKKIGEVKKQIDEIIKTGTCLNKATNQLEKTINILPKKEREYAKEIILSVKKYQEKTREIKNILYAINNDGKGIFERIITEDGILSEDHIIALNEHIPEAENNFDTLSFLYLDLIKIKEKIETNYQLLNTQ